MNEMPPPIPSETIEPQKRLWPWVLLQFLPAVAITIYVLSQMSSLARFPVSWQIIPVAAFLYGYVLSFFFFRSRGKSVPISLLYAVGAALIVFAANVILILGIVFVGCLVLMGTGFGSR